MKAVGGDPGDIPNVGDSEYQGVVGVQVTQLGRLSIQAAGRRRNPCGRRDQGALQIDLHGGASCSEYGRVEGRLVSHTRCQRAKEGRRGDVATW